MPSIPVYLSLDPSNAPLPISESHTGASTFSTNFLSSSDASDITAPPPTNTYGFLAFLISVTALSISSSLMLAVILSTGFGTLGVYSHSAAVTSLVTSTSTGPGLPSFAILKAFLNVFARSFTFLTI